MERSQPEYRDCPEGLEIEIVNEMPSLLDMLLEFERRQAEGETEEQLSELRQQIAKKVE